MSERLLEGIDDHGDVADSAEIFSPSLTTGEHISVIIVLIGMVGAGVLASEAIVATPLVHSLVDRLPIIAHDPYSMFVNQSMAHLVADSVGAAAGLTIATERFRQVFNP